MTRSSRLVALSGVCALVWGIGHAVGPWGRFIEHRRDNGRFAIHSVRLYEKALASALSLGERVGVRAQTAPSPALRATSPAGRGHSSSAPDVATRCEATRKLFAYADPLALTADAAEPILIDGPYVTFESQSKAIISWDTREPCPSVLEYGKRGQDKALLQDKQPKRSHSIELGALQRNTEYTYRIRLAPQDNELATPEYTLDTEFDFSIPVLPAGEDPYPDDALTAVYAEAATYILADSGIGRGYCLDYGCADGRLAYEIAQRSKLQVVGVSTDRRAIERGREGLIATGHYGCRLTLRHLRSLDRLPFPDLCANLIISGEVIARGRLRGNAEEVKHKLRPLGGKAYLGVPANAESRLTERDLAEWIKTSIPEDSTAEAAGAARLPGGVAAPNRASREPSAAAAAPGPHGLACPRHPAGRAPTRALSGRRAACPTGPVGADVASRVVRDTAGLWVVMDRAQPLPRAGEWTHAYGTAGQTTNSNDQLVYGQAGATLEVQWFGLPGPNAMIDRQVRMQGPVSSAGRIFTQGHNRLIAQDAYNGSILWSMEIPNLRRTNLPRNTGNACVNRDYVFVAVRDHCWRLDADTGRRSMSYPVADNAQDTSYDWGYVATEGDTLFGSAVRRGNMDTGFAGPQFWFDATSGTDTHNVCSDNLFANRSRDGNRLWTYSEGLIINPTVSMGGGRIYFLESRSAQAINSPARKLGPELWGETWVVALDARTGKTAWEKPFRIGTHAIVVYLVYHDEQIAVVSSFGGEYHIATLAAPDGAPLWQAKHQWRSDNHGHHIQHPVIAQGRMFLEPNVYDWKTGEKIALDFPGRSKCGTITGAANLLHYRDFNDEVWDLNSNTQSEFTKLRSNCWIGMISGNGLLMSPASGGGCSCPWPIYTSLTYRTKDDY